MPKSTIVTEFTFDSTHYIKDYDGPCGQMHGHNYKVRIEATSDRLHAKQLPDSVRLKVAASETPNCWVEYEDD